ncbi:hypothetical protein [Microbacterium sp.]|uniref:hypothetical protein n=1 Tax=Microbacterium sp. TaxID=51671 RepID=UPI0035615EAE
MSEPQQPSAQQHPDQPPQGQFRGQPPHGGQSYPSGQQYQGQQYPGQQYQGQQYPGQQYPGAPAKAAGSGLGRLAFILALASLAVGFVVALAFPVIVRTLQDTYAIGLVSAMGNGLVLVVAIVTLILGLMAVRRPGSPILAGIAIGIAATQIAGIVISWVSNLFYAFTF